MDIKTILTNFFIAENSRSWAAYRKYLSPDVTWELNTGGQTKAINGADDYVGYLQAVYERYNTTFVCESLYSQGNRAVAILKNSLGERSCDIFDFADGLIVREYEFILT
jgi:hypothetical protein